MRLTLSLLGWGQWSWVLKHHQMNWEQAWQVQSLTSPFIH